MTYTAIIGDICFLLAIIATVGYGFVYPVTGSQAYSVKKIQIFDNFQFNYNIIIIIKRMVHYFQQKHLDYLFLIQVYNNN